VAGVGGVLHIADDREERRCRAAVASMLGVSLFRGATPKRVKRNRKHVAYL